MAAEQLTIVVTCTDRKSAPPDPSLMARALELLPATDRPSVWSDRIDRATGRTRLIDLYQGETWVQAKRLIATARSIGYEPEVFVASAGLGLRSVRDLAPSYSATFTLGQPDSVSATHAGAKQWWANLPHAPATVGGRAIWVLSENYARAAGRDLLLRTSPEHLLVFGGSSDIPEHLRVPADRALRHALGGTTTSLNVRAATQWLQLTKNTGAFTDKAHTTWTHWATQSRRVEEYKRKPLSDEEVIQYIRNLKRKEPTVSKSKALKLMRVSGMACEQRRFSELFQKAAAL